MSPEQKRKFNTAMGSLFLVAGLVGWGLTVYFAVTPNPPKPAPTFVHAVVDLPSCAQTLQRLGYSETRIDNKDVVAFEAMSSDPKEQLDRATLAANVCKLEMKSFCMGEGCARPGLTLTLQMPQAMRTAQDTLPKSRPVASAMPKPSPAVTVPAAPTPAPALKQPD